MHRGYTQGGVPRGVRPMALVGGLPRLLEQVEQASRGEIFSINTERKVAHRIRILATRPEGAPEPAHFDQAFHGEATSITLEKKYCLTHQHQFRKDKCLTHRQFSQYNSLTSHNLIHAGSKALRLQREERPRGHADFGLQEPRVHASFG